ncbi:MAG: response regulator [Pseudomonadota bacterium]
MTAEASNPPSDNITKVSVLLVEDDELDVLATRRALRSIAHLIDFHTTSNGREALDLLRCEEPHLQWPLLILLDLNMPEMDGFAFLDALRHDAALSLLPVVVFTTSDREQDIVEAYERHVIGYVRKPLDPTRDQRIVEFLDTYLQTVILPKDDPRLAPR